MQPDPSTPADAPTIRTDAIDPDALKVLRRLQHQGFKAYLVGGCVRDLLLGHTPKDFDIATDARPRQMKRLFRNSRIIGRRFRLVHVHFGPRVLEVATFRAPPIPDGDTEADDLYIKRDNVFGTEEQDAERRDFTINGLFYDVHAKKVIDHVDGLADLRAGLLRTIGDAEVRMREDPVRILRAARFAGRLDFNLTPELHEAARRHREDLRKAAPPRVLEEIYKLLSGHGSSRAFQLLDELGALSVLLPEISPPEDGFFDSLLRLEQESGGRRDGARQSLLLAVLLGGHVRKALEGHDLRDAEHVVHDALRPVVERLTVARRDTALARQCLAAQMRMAAPPHGRPATRLCRRDYFDEAMALMRVIGAADEDHITAWLDHKREATKGQSARGPKPRRRKRRRRGGKKRNDKESACPSPPESSSAPAPPEAPEASQQASSSDGSPPA